MKKFKLMDLGQDGSIVETETGRSVLTLSLDKWADTLKFELKIRNGELVPQWVGDVLIWVPA